MLWYSTSKPLFFSPCVQDTQNNEDPSASHEYKTIPVTGPMLPPTLDPPAAFWPSAWPPAACAAASGQPYSSSPCWTWAAMKILWEKLREVGNSRQCVLPYPSHRCLIPQTLKNANMLLNNSHASMSGGFIKNADQLTVVPLSYRHSSTFLDLSSKLRIKLLSHTHTHTIEVTYFLY